jgi:hypothetical protein
MKRANKETYLAERERAIVTLYNAVRRFRADIEKISEYAGFVPDTETAAILQAYVPAQLALLDLMKEESEE